VSTESIKPGPLEVRDPKVLRAMAHPARLAILEHLTEGHEATATECAEISGLSPSAMSYHLRALAKAGLIEEAPSRGDGRERVWRSPVRGVSIDFDVDATNPDDETMPAAVALVEMVLRRDDAAARQWLARAHEEPKEWNDAVGILRINLVLTAEELLRLQEDIRKLVEPYGRFEREPPPGSRKVAALFRAFPADAPPP
jgi:DNA-binding transcriptional ArsR family regulator